MDIPTVPGAWYTVATATTCEITDTATGTPLGTANAGSYSFQAQGNLTTLSDDSALYSKSNFNSAPAKLRLLGLLGGGNSTGSALPAGYLEADFVEITSYFTNVPIFTVSPATAEPELEAVVKTRQEYLSGVNFLTSDTTQFEIMLYIAWANACRWNFGGNEVVKGLLTADKKQVIKKTGRYNYIDGVLVSTNTPTAPTASQKVRLTDRLGSKFILYSLRADNTAGEKREYIAAVDDAGKPCLFDTVNKETFNIPCAVGFTLKQALKLSTLPATGGSLTVSLPTGYESDAGVMSALETARSNGWTLTVQTYTPETAAEGATFALRRIWVRRTQDENGAYIDADEKRWQVVWCVEMYTPDGSTPDQHGYELFRSQEAAVAYWELTPYVDPETENLLTE